MNPEEVALRSRWWTTRGRPVACLDGFDRRPAHRGMVADRQLDDLARDRLAGRPSEPARDDDRRPAGERGEGPRVEVVRVRVRDHDEVDIAQPGRIGDRSVTLERAEPWPQERIRQD